jgi:hypothetical protein
MALTYRTPSSSGRLLIVRNLRIRRGDRLNDGTPTSQHVLRLISTFRLLTIAAGVLLILLAVPAHDQAVRLAVGGVALMLVGWLYRPFLARYRGLALIVLNILILLAVVELAATALLAVVTLPVVKSLVARATGQTNDLIAHYAALPYYREQSWTEQHWNEFRSAIKKVYSPYVVWRSPPYSGETINIDASGIRYTPGAECGPDSYRVFLFGGSALWGWGSPDWGTIAAYLQDELSRKHDGPVCVVNFGEQAFVSIQNVVQLTLELDRGNVPALVLFYDGVNEVLAASQTRQPMLHQNYAEIANRFEGDRNPLPPVVGASNVFRLARMVLARLAPPSPPSADPRALETPQLVDAVVDTYLGNLRLASALAKEYDFELHFFLQPHILVGDKPLSNEEQAILEGLDWVLRLDDDLRELFSSTYSRIEVAARTRPGLHGLSDVFDHETSQLWIDTWGHVTPEGNRIVAQRILEVIEPSAPVSDPPDVKVGDDRHTAGGFPRRGARRCG